VDGCTDGWATGQTDWRVTHGRPDPTEGWQDHWVNGRTGGRPGERMVGPVEDGRPRGQQACQVDEACLTRPPSTPTRHGAYSVAQALPVFTGIVPSARRRKY